MKTIGNYIMMLMILSFGFLLLTSQAIEEIDKTMQAGFSTTKITPEKPVRMSGYAARKEPFKGVHDDLYASSAVFQSADTKACIITSDVIGFSHEFTDQTREKIQQATGIPSENIMVTAAHNHGGPRTRAYGEEPTENEKEYVEDLMNKLVNITIEALGKLQPAKFAVGTGTCRMNVNRRAVHAEGGIWLGRNPAGICDQEVGVIRVEDENGTTLGMLVNWPCHATTGGQDNYQITGDWPGATARKLEENYPGAVIMISAGASGDINPIYGPNTSFNDINAIGEVLAGEVLNINKEMETYEWDELKIKSDMIKAKGKKASESRMPNVSLDPAPHVEIRLSTIKIGPVAIAGISGELMNEIGLTIKDNSPYKNTFIYTHCNGNSGYLCTDESYREGGYEPMVSRTMPGTQYEINKAFRKMLNEL